jgi:hypothetical protein
MESKPNMMRLNNQKMIEREELDKLNAYNPFGRGGGGAPMRDNSGNIVTVRKNIGSDNGLVPSRVVSGRPELNQANNFVNNYPVQGMSNTMPMNMPRSAFDNFQPKYYYNYNDYFDPRNENRQGNGYVPYQRELMENNSQPNYATVLPVSRVKQSEQIPQAVVQIAQPKPQTETEVIHNNKLYYQSILKQQIDEKKLRDEIRKKQDEEMDRLEEMKYNEYL